MKLELTNARVSTTNGEIKYIFVSFQVVYFYLNAHLYQYLFEYFGLIHLSYQIDYTNYITRNQRRIDPKIIGNHPSLSPSCRTSCLPPCLPASLSFCVPPSLQASLSPSPSSSPPYPQRPQSEVDSHLHLQKSDCKRDASVERGKYDGKRRI